MLRIHYHRDFDGAAAAAILASALEATGREERVSWSGVNYDARLDWERFSEAERFAVVDFHFHPRAVYWFDHHPTAFLDEADRQSFRNDENRCFDPDSPSCPPIILRHAQQHWGYQPLPWFEELASWSDVVDAAAYDSADQALFDTAPALRLSRSLSASPDLSYADRLVGLMREMPPDGVAEQPEVRAAWTRAERNRDKALESYSSTIVAREARVVLCDQRSKKIRRERFAPFWHAPELQHAVVLLPTRAGPHITVSENPWNRPLEGPHLGQMLAEYGGGGHQGVGGANPPNGEVAGVWARELFDRLVAMS